LLKTTFKTVAPALVAAALLSTTSHVGAATRYHHQSITITQKKECWRTFLFWKSCIYSAAHALIDPADSHGFSKRTERGGGSGGGFLGGTAQGKATGNSGGGFSGGTAQGKATGGPATGGTTTGGTTTAGTNTGGTTTGGTTTGGTTTA